MTESETEEFERLKRRFRGNWIAEIQIELIKHDANALLVTIDNHETFLGLKPEQAALKAIKLYRRSA